MIERPILFNSEKVRAILDGQKTQMRRPVKPQPPKDSWLHEVYGLNYAVEELRGKLSWFVSAAGDLWPCNREDAIISPFGMPGDELYVRETWRIGAWKPLTEVVAIDYRSDGYCRQEWLELDDDLNGDSINELFLDSEKDASEAGVQFDQHGACRWEPGQSPCRWRSPATMPKEFSRIRLKVKRVWVERVQDMSAYDIQEEGFTFKEKGHPERLINHEFRQLWDSIYKSKGFGWDVNPWVFACEFEVITKNK